MRAKYLPILFIGALLIVTGCTKNSLRSTTHTSSQQCSGPEMLAENILPDYVESPGNDGNISDVLTSDNSGNVYIENAAQGALSLDATNGILGVLPGYLYKFDVFGKQVFTKPIITNYQSVIAADSMQNVYLGYFTILNTPYHCIVNVVKYNNAGDTTWSKHIYYDQDALFNSLGVSNSGILHVAAYVPSIPLDNQYNDPTVTVQPGSGDMVYTFDQSGALIKVKQVNQVGHFNLNDFYFFPSGNFNYISYISSGASVNGYDINSASTGNTTIPMPAKTNVFYDERSNVYSVDSTTIAKYSGSTELWSVKTQPYKTIRSDADGNIYIAGTFNGSVNFDPDGTAKTLTAKGANDSFIEKFDTNGKIVWVIQSLGTDGKTYTGASQVDNFLVTNKNEIFVTGTAFNSKTSSKTHFASFYTQCN